MFQYGFDELVVEVSVRVYLPVKTDNKTTATREAVAKVMEALAKGGIADIIHTEARVVRP